MAVDLTTVSTSPYVDVITLGLANVATRVDLPTQHMASVSVQFRANAGKVAWGGTDGAAVSADHNQIAADTFVEYKMAADRSKRAASIYLASATGSTVVEVEIE